MTDVGRKPSWLRVSYSASATQEVRDLMKQLALNTVCRAANCPNMATCYRHRTATFMILGAVCTRNCRFCNVCPGKPEPVDANEPSRLADAVQRLGLRHVVITSVTRDDLPDGGASQFAACIRALRKLPDAPRVEVLIPDFRGDSDALDQVLEAEPDVLNHNVETVASLYADVRPQASYAQSLEVLARAHRRMRGGFVKTGFMLGLGETESEVSELMRDIRATGCDLLTIGQYLPPSPQHAPLRAYIPPERFEALRKEALARGFAYCEAGPLVRSSFMAGEAYRLGMEAAEPR